MDEQHKREAEYLLDEADRTGVSEKYMLKAIADALLALVEVLKEKR